MPRTLLHTYEHLKLYNKEVRNCLPIGLFHCILKDPFESNVHKQSEIREKDGWKVFGQIEIIKGPLLTF